MRPTTPMPRQKAQKEKMPPKNSFGASRWHPFPLGAGPATFCFWIFFLHRSPILDRVADQPDLLEGDPDKVL